MPTITGTKQDAMALGCGSGRVEQAINKIALSPLGHKKLIKEARKVELVKFPGTRLSLMRAL